ncbi:hypothetical protein CO100_00480 [Candidatus Berkelbacteria bacterium CG_4_9_14_3_um_filter_33_5]|uniref:SHS2 domain-containing protein n=1 Tax=Candidatus Berkelbacteria bacterium CG_4_10_14_0_2_um_filter_35_9_33_12 TaxID=1974499 RepID=A0A2M7W4Y4_9BACT|nr:MAG: hypothetical protein COX10_01200 [Candidatus Berkelbacteria bacterium CG23_combo_of_CG06-09_8_20_14_all_33_15]PIS08191.1 MAG: hypothetical protein COT76_02750 [Candidatus Berkelbacteria bacterium CG10_big_fil_rev_8_21_14_0_10_33_10]PJA21014.1 MAG: hypothetical protein COX60_00155 [Candidatus Berkelbacteria bacterium CG_4_10_14_0_2_um_filter_35_9_33_12]PJB52137.1 MAG: hypothetical protein CO100_00480 [Candidatus Berkelbacteria bacterium CG_4_9_14_3_um_filter_33_5]
MFHLLNPKKYQNWGIALDIGTAFVKAVIFEVKNGQANIKGYGFQRQRLSDMHGGVVTDIAGVVENSESALEMAAKNAGVLPYQIVMGIAGELVKGTTTTVKYQRENPKINITIEELKGIVSKIQDKSFSQAKTALVAETGHQEIDIKLVNTAIVDVRIDNYKVTNPVGFQGKTIEIGVYNAFAPNIHLSALQTIAEQLEFDLLSVAAEPYAVARAVAEEEAVDFSAIILDIGGGTSDIAIVSNGGVEGTKMFGMGGRSFTKSIADKLNIPFSQSEQLKIDYSNRQLEDGEKKSQIKDAVCDNIDVWIMGVKLMLEDFSNLDLFPSRILLCGGGSLLPEIKAVLETEKWHNIPFAKKPKVSFLHPNNVAKINDEKKLLDNPQDVTPLALVNVAIDLIGSDTIIENVKSKIKGSLRR